MEKPGCFDMLPNCNSNLAAALLLLSQKLGGYGEFDKEIAVDLPFPVC